MKTEALTYKDGETLCHGILVYDETKTGPRPGVMVAPDIRGVGMRGNECHSKLAAIGYVVLMADTYGDGTQMRDFPHGMGLMKGLMGNPKAWRARSRAAFDALAARPEVDKDKMAAMGHCFGGSTVLELALSGVPAKAVISFHGALDTLTLADAANTRARLLVCTGAEDPLIPAADVVKLQEALRQAKVANWEVNTYSSAKHAFTDPASADNDVAGYNKTADERSWAAAANLLKATLG